jgi:radical SAM enzyme (TIGR01210 family)
MKDKRSPTQLEALWKESDMVDGEKVKAMVVILRTNGCCWVKHGGCTMCGYREASLHNVTEQDLMMQLDQALSKYKGEPFVKIYTSGSFLDENEVPVSVREKILEAFSGCKRILFESRPEFITPEVVETLPSTVTVALGLESSNPEVLRTSVHKGFTPDDILRAGTLLHDKGLGVRTYLLLKPLYMTEDMAIADAVSSARFADAFSDEISINPLNVQRGTYVERMWKRGEFRSPWIWSLVDVFRQLHGTVSARLMSSPSGGGAMRGVHNCGACDQKALDAIESFSFSQNIDDLDVKCDCISKWENYRVSEQILGSPADLDRDFENELVLRK